MSDENLISWEVKIMDPKFPSLVGHF